MNTKLKAPGTKRLKLTFVKVISICFRFAFNFNLRRYTMVLRHCPGLKFLDGKEVTMEERDHVDYLFSPVDAAAAAQVGAYTRPLSGST